MKKNVFGRQFKRDRNERKALFKSLMSALVLNDRIKTTEEKAKAIKGQVEKLVTKVKKGGTRVSALLDPYLTPDAKQKLISEIAPGFKKRPGGYTRLIKLGQRFSDNASTVLMEWVEEERSNIKDQISKTDRGTNFSASENLSDSVVARKASRKRTSKNKKPVTTETQKKLKRRKEK